jgi:release factor glutamine methyltransferase
LSTILELIQILTTQFNDSSDTASLDAQVLIAHILGKNRTWVLAHADTAVNPRQEKQVYQALQQLKAGKALPYLIGQWEFYGLPFYVNQEVLIPRPETEVLVELAIKWLESHPGYREALDVGTGSGCIAITLAVHVMDLRIMACDISLPVLELARKNALRHRVSDRVNFLQSHLLSPVKQKVHLICANLPYIPSDRLDGLAVAHHEPRLALDGGLEGLELIKLLLMQAKEMILPSGLILIEIDSSQGIPCLAYAKRIFPARDIRIISDLSGRERILQINPQAAY